MLLTHSTEQISGTDYRTEYEILESKKERENSLNPEYGISCKLFKADKTVALETVNGITTQRTRAEKILHILEKNQVFPVHLRDVIEDLLILEFEEREYNY